MYYGGQKQALMKLGVCASEDGRVRLEGTRHDRCILPFVILHLIFNNQMSEWYGVAWRD
jgi:hypothetical protein